MPLFGKFTCSQTVYTIITCAAAIGDFNTGNVGVAFKGNTRSVTVTNPSLLVIQATCQISHIAFRITFPTSAAHMQCTRVNMRNGKLIRQMCYITVVGVITQVTNPVRWLSVMYNR